MFVCDDALVLWNMDHDFAHLAHEFGHVISSNDSDTCSGLDSSIIVINIARRFVISASGLKLSFDDFVSDREEAVKECSILVSVRLSFYSSSKDFSVKCFSIGLYLSSLFC